MLSLRPRRLNRLLLEKQVSTLDSKSLPQPRTTDSLCGEAGLGPLGEYWMIASRRDHQHRLPERWNPKCLNLKEEHDLMAAGHPNELLFLDLETCGFAGTPLFLVGLMTLSRDEVHITQFLARNYEEEAAVIEAACRKLGRARAFVSFNGRSYDLPFLRDRARRHRLGQVPDRPHFDLLHASRRRWKHALPNCRLKTLERSLLNRYRTGDVPGSEVPDLYHHYVRTGDSALITGVLDHNTLDLVSLADLLGLILQTRVDRVSGGR